MPLPREAWPKAPRGLAMPGKGSGPRVRGRRGAERSGAVCAGPAVGPPRGQGVPPALGALPRGGGGGRGQPLRRGPGALGGCDAVCPTQLASG